MTVGATAAPGRDPGMVGPYRLVSRLGEGGMGVVHLAIDSDGRAVALKVLRAHVAADPQARMRLAREVAILRRIRHPRVAEVLDADVDGDMPYVVTRFVPGRPLDALIREGGALATPDVVRLGQALAEALGAIHAAGVVHRDVKPANVMIMDGEPVLIDFGIAHVADESRITHTGLVMGTPGFLSPEVSTGDPVAPATDWWGWGATLAYAATGRPPFGSGPIEVVLDRVRRGHVDLDGVAEPLRSTLAAALVVDAAQRPGAQVLLARLAGPPGSAAPTQAYTVATPLVTPTLAYPTGHPTGHPTARQPGPPTVSPTGRLTAAPKLPSPAPVARPVPTRPVAASAPGQAPAPVSQTADPRSRRLGLVAVILLALAITAAAAPTAAFVLAVVGMVLARTVDRTATALWRRRHNAGPRRSDTAMVALGTPGRVVLAALATLPALVLPALIAVSVLFIVAAVQRQGTPLGPDHPTALALGMAAGLVTAWHGPGGGALRRGTRSVLRAASRRPRGGQVLVGVLILLVVADAMLLGRHGVPDWAPLTSSPFAQLVASRL